MKKLILIFLALSILTSCNNDDDDTNSNEQDYLIFGHFYGFCGGESCVETYKLTDNSLFEDTIDDYSGVDLDFVELDNETFEEVKDLVNFFPDELSNQNETIFGCPDCSDGGGLFIQYSKNGSVMSWRIDQFKSNVPNYLHDFMDKVNEKIALINS